MTNTLIFYESALELIPESLQKHPLVRKEWLKNTKKKNRGILLDGAIHRPLMDSLEGVGKRGRPDIIHHSLMNVVFSPLFRKKEIQVFIHTRNNLSTQIPSDWRVPVNYNRFCGLFSQLLLKKRVPLSGEAILTVEKISLIKLLDQFRNSNVYLCEQSTQINDRQIMEKNLNEISSFSSNVFLIGGYQHGDAEFFNLEPRASTQDWSILTLYDEIKPAWVITAKIVHWLETSDR